MKIGNNPYDIALNPVTNRLYITNMRFHTVSVVDGSTDKLIADIRVGKFPLGLVVNSDTTGYMWPTHEKIQFLL